MTVTVAESPHTPLNVSLEGDLLIEASAGTGKTYALTTLVARYIVETGQTIDRLLVVTFTIAAAGELRDRLRRTLRGALDALQQGVDDDPQASDLVVRWRSLGIADEEAQSRLYRALGDFDRANVMTIHGFCQRVLTEFAFDSGIPFGFAVSGDDELEVGVAVRDFWRREVAPAPTLLLEQAIGHQFSLGQSLEWIRDRYAKPGLDIRPVMVSTDLWRRFEGQRKAFLQAFAAVRADRQQNYSTLLEALGALKWRKGHWDKIVLAVKTLDEAFERNDPALLRMEDASLLSANSLDEKLLKKPPQDLPEHPLLRHFDLLHQALGKITALSLEWRRDQRRKLIGDVRQALRRCAWEERRLSFNGLIGEVARALDGDAESLSGHELARRMRNRYPRALIDEFQDTDRLQARIFKHIYSLGAARHGTSEADAGGLTIVGDPKQSIYRFRGADIFAYLDASRLQRRRLNLTMNYRSTPGLVRAVNALFKRPNPFLLPALEFVAAQAAKDGSEALRIKAGQSGALAPFQLRLFPGTCDGKAWGKSKLEAAAARDAALEIVRLLQLAHEGRAMLGEGLAKKPLNGGDIAVLVRTRRQGQAMARELRRHRVQSVEIDDCSVFATSQATHLHRILRALTAAEADFAANDLLRGALGAAMFGLDMGELGALKDDDGAWAQWSERRRGWREVWRRSGVAALIRQLLFRAPTHCAERLLSLPDGPRQLTNLLHLAELLQQAEVQECLSPKGLAEWLANCRANPLPGEESTQLRLESDEQLVKIVTIHRSKGLEFPIVFCPFAWHGRGLSAKDTAQYHDWEGAGRGEAADPDQEGEAFAEVLDLEPTEDARNQERLEERSEELRLLYVALTRAQCRCVVTWARAKDAENTALAWLLHGHNETGSADANSGAPREVLLSNAKRFKELDASAWLTQVMRFVQSHNGAIAATVAPDAEAAPTAVFGPPIPIESVIPTAHELQRSLRRHRQITSYSALAAEAGVAVSPADHEAVEQADHDQDEASTVEGDGELEASALGPGAAADTLDPALFPRGRHAGACLHEIFETFAKAGGRVEAAGVQRALAKARIDRKWVPLAQRMVEDAWATPLAASGPWGAFRLGDLAATVAEMEFHLPATGLNRARLGQCLAEHGYGDPFGDGEGSAEINGFLHGYIDLVVCDGEHWYVIDYKSNWLGGDIKAYSSDALSAAMRRCGYHLQYLLYLTALHRHLRLRLPDYGYDRHMGGALYLFVRGMQPDRPGHGVYWNRPNRACIEAIDACFAGAPA